MYKCYMLKLKKTIKLKQIPEKKLKQIPEKKLEQIPELGEFNTKDDIFKKVYDDLNNLKPFINKNDEEINNIIKTHLFFIQKSLDIQVDIQSLNELIAKIIEYFKEKEKNINTGEEIENMIDIANYIYSIHTEIKDIYLNRQEKNTKEKNTKEKIREEEKKRQEEEEKKRQAEAALADRLKYGIKQPPPLSEFGGKTKKQKKRKKTYKKRKTRTIKK